MKKILLIMLLLSAGTAFGESMDGLIGHFSKAAEAKSRTVTRSDKKLRQFNRMKGNKIRLHSIQILNLEACSPQIHDDFRERAANVGDGYEVLVKTTNEGKNMQVLAKRRGKQIRELVMIVTGEKDGLIRVHGNGNLSKFNMDFD